MIRAYISIGSNIDRERNVASGLRALRTRYGPLLVSPIYDTRAVGFDGPRFYNLVVGIDTASDPYSLVAELRAIERTHGRLPGIPKYSSRTLDLDLLTWGDVILDREGLRLPRPGMLRYAFVLRPLADIAGRERHPVDGRTYAQIWAACDSSRESLQRVAAAR